MTVHIDTWQTVLGFFGTLFMFMSTVAVLHWRLFVQPRLRKMLDPIRTSLAVATRVLKELNPGPYERAEKIAADEGKLWSQG